MNVVLPLPHADPTAMVRGATVSGAARNAATPRTCGAKPRRSSSTLPLASSLIARVTTAKASADRGGGTAALDGIVEPGDFCSFDAFAEKFGSTEPDGLAER